MTRKEKVLSWSVWVTASAILSCNVDPGEVETPTALYEPETVSRQTTSEALALGNLDGHIQALRKRLKLDETDLVARRSLFEAWVLLIEFQGQYSKLRTVDQLTQEALGIHEGSAESLLLRARFLLLTHQFTRAERVIQEAKRASEHRPLAASLEQTLALATGDVLAFDASRASSSNDFLLRANVLASQNEFSEADAMYAAALDSARTVSPFVIASIHFRRGLMWAELAGRTQLAIRFYQEAVRVLPSYVRANVHLAELEQPEAAIERLESVQTMTEDPEAWGVLAELYKERAPERSKGLLLRAREAYDRLLTQYPDAFASHGAEFFLGPGDDVGRAWRLARRNAQLRTTQEATTLAGLAAHANGLNACGPLSRDAHAPVLAPALISKLHAAGILFPERCNAGG